MPVAEFGGVAQDDRWLMPKWIETMVSMALRMMVRMITGIATAAVVMNVRLVATTMAMIEGAQGRPTSKCKLPKASPKLL
jgi:hypothetical protein